MPLPLDDADLGLTAHRIDAISKKFRVRPEWYNLIVIPLQMEDWYFRCG